MTDVPFRWDLTNRSHLGRLVEGETAASYPAFAEELLVCCAKVLALAGDSDLIFVGRSPESIFDNLSGLLLDTAWFSRLELLHFSKGFSEEHAMREKHPEAITAMRSYLEHLALNPQGIATRVRPAAFIDLALTGNTFGHLVNFFREWTTATEYDWNAVRRRMRVIGITETTKTSPKTWRWQQHAAWVSMLPRGSIKNVSIPRSLWTYLGDYQYKVSRSYTPERWGDPELGQPSYSIQQISALRLAYELFESGRTKQRRQQFTSLLVKQPAMKHQWFRKLVQEIRRSATDRS